MIKYIDLECANAWLVFVDFNSFILNNFVIPEILERFIQFRLSNYLLVVYVCYLYIKNDGLWDNFNEDVNTLYKTHLCKIYVALFYLLN